jgi:hypothetical protein
MADAMRRLPPGASRDSAQSDPGDLERLVGQNVETGTVNTTSSGAAADEFLSLSLTIVDNLPAVLDYAGDCDNAGVLSGLDVGAGRTTQSAGRLRTRAR